MLLFILFWIALSFALFMISAGQQNDKISDSTRSALDDSGNLLTSPNNILVLGSDRRPGEERGRADTIMLMRYGGGKAARLSIPRDTLVNIPGVGPSKINAAYAIGGQPLMIETIKQFLGIEVNHLIEVDFKGFPKFVDALGGVDMTFEKCIRSRFEGRTHRFKKGENHLNGEEALDVVRIRKNECAPEESDLTRARRQQQFLEAVKGKLFSPFTFPRWPWAAWRAPKAIISDMGGLAADDALLEHGDERRPEAAHPAPDRPGREPAAGVRRREAGRGAALPRRLRARRTLAPRRAASSVTRARVTERSASGPAYETPACPADAVAASRSSARQPSPQRTFLLSSHRFLRVGAGWMVAADRPR